MLISSVLAAFFLVGCVTEPQIRKEIPWQQIKADIPSTSALVYVVRPFAHGAAGTAYKIQINGEHIADLKTGTFITHAVPAGDVSVYAAIVQNIFTIGLDQLFVKKPELTIQAHPGEIVFVNVEVAFSGGPKLSIVDSATGKRLVEESTGVESLNSPDD
jgi:hypothetical protein